jgi:hypothetical protein
MTMTRIVLLLLSIAIQQTAAHAHHRLADYYDVKRTVTLKGSVSGLYFSEQHVWIFVDVVDANEQASTWAVEGNSFSEMGRTGWTLGFDAPSPTIKTGDVIEVTAYLPKDGVKLEGTFPPYAPLPIMMALEQRLKETRIAHGGEATLADGRKLVFGDTPAIDH